MITIIIIVITVFTSWKSLDNSDITVKYNFSPYRIRYFSEYYRFISYAFIHASWEHLLFNMFSLFFIGFSLENELKLLYNQYFYVIYLTLYLTAIPISTLYSFYRNNKNAYYSSIGASGAVSSIVFGLILLNPTTKFYLFALPIGIPAYIFGIVYLASAFYLSKKNNDNIAHDAHISGAIWGIIFLIIINPGLLVNFFHQIKESY